MNKAIKGLTATQVNNILNDTMSKDDMAELLIDILFYEHITDEDIAKCEQSDEWCFKTEMKEVEDNIFVHEDNIDRYKQDNDLSNYPEHDQYQSYNRF